MRQRDVQQTPGVGQPARLAGRLMQRQQPLGQAAVVVEHPRRGAHLPVARRAPQPAVDEMRSSSSCAHSFAAARYSRPASCTPASASAAIARPFHAVTTLSSRAGCGRIERAANNRVRQSAHRAGSSGSARSCRVDVPCSKVPASVTSSSCGGRRPVGPEHFGQLRRRPHVGRALDAVGVGVKADANPPSRCAGRAAGSPRSPAPPAGPVAHRSTPRPVQVGAQQQRVVVEHLLEVRHHPGRRPRTGRIPRRAGRRSRRAPSPRTVRSAISSATAVAGAPVMTQQEFQHHRRREFRRATETAVARVERGANRVHAPSSTAASNARRLRHRAARRGRGPRRRAARRRDTSVAVVAPRLGHGLQQSQKLAASGSRCRRRTVRRRGRAGRSSASRPGRSARRSPPCRRRRRQGAPRGRP